MHTVSNKLKTCDCAFKPSQQVRPFWRITGTFTSLRSLRSTRLSWGPKFQRRLGELQRLCHVGMKWMVRKRTIIYLNQEDWHSQRRNLADSNLQLGNSDRWIVKFTEENTGKRRKRRNGPLKPSALSNRVEYSLKSTNQTSVRLFMVKGCTMLPK